MIVLGTAEGENEYYLLTAFIFGEKMLNATNLGKNMQEDFQKLYKSKKRRASWLAFFDFFPPNGRMNSTQKYIIN